MDHDERDRHDGTQIWSPRRRALRLGMEKIPIGCGPCYRGEILAKTAASDRREAEQESDIARNRFHGGRWHRQSCLAAIAYS